MKQTSLHRPDPILIICDRIAEEVTSQAAIVTGEEMRRWPAGFMDAAVTSRLFEKTTRAERIECHGCSRRCSRAVEYATNTSGRPKRLSMTCELRDDVTYIPVTPQRVERWRMTRQQLVGFVARELNLSVPAMTNVLGMISLGTFKGRRVRRAIAIEFTDKVWLLAGGARIDITEIMRWSGDRVVLDHEELENRANASPDRLIGGKRYQPSRSKQQLSAELTAQRNRRLQRRADQLKHAHPTWKKSAIAAALIKSSEFPGLRERTTVERIIRVPKN